jgi:hypothetical protein
MDYTLKCNEAQLRVINIALEEYFRLRLGQMGDLANDLSMLSYQNLSEEERHEFFDKILQTREHTRFCLDAAYRIATDDRRSHNQTLIGKTHYRLFCEDIWRVIRHQLWLDAGGPEHMPGVVDGDEPRPVSNEPLPTVQRENPVSAK